MWCAYYTPHWRFTQIWGWSQRIIANHASFTGGEYWTISRKDPIVTHPDIEELSQICKYATNHCIPRSTKQQIALWAKEIGRFTSQFENSQSVKKVEKTDFYNDSIEFDKIYSKYGNGYWQSDCEMFARAFDCYITDKLNDLGYRSDFLTSHADSFHYHEGDRLIAAYPRGEERTEINKAFDILFAELKERQMLHDAPVIEPVIASEPIKPSPPVKHEMEAEPKNVRYEQLSLDELLFSASVRASQSVSGRNGNLSDRADRSR